MKLSFIVLAAAVVAGLPAIAAHAAEPAPPPATAPLIRFPTVSADAVAFVARGDLWSAPRDGGPAHRLVKSDGAISAPRFSPDGRWIAYTARERGGQDVYVVAASGGESRRLTFDARPGLDGNLVSGWTPDGRRIVFLSDRGAWAQQVLQAYIVALTGGMAERLPLGTVGRLSLAADGHTVAYANTSTDFVLRKRILSGQASDIFTYDLASRRLTRITDWKGTDADPMWVGRRIYFLSDRGAGFRANVWRYDLDTGQTTQVTRFTDYDVDWPSAGADRIVFQQGGRLWALDLPSERLHELSVAVPDDGARTAPRVEPVDKQARATDVTHAVDYAVSPHGESVAVSAHGDIFAVPTAGGPPRDLTATPAIDEEHPAWSPDGASVAYVTEADGAQQVAVRPLAGGPERRLTRFAAGVLYAPKWSPDGAVLAVASAEHELWRVSVADGGARLVARDPAAEIRDAAFSPDGRWLAYSTQRFTGVRAIHLQDLASGRDTVVSSPMESDRLPAFSSDGRTLYFVSQRHELPFVSDRDDEASIATMKSDGVYAAALAQGPAVAGAPMRVDLDGLMARAVALPASPARIVSLETRGPLVVYETRPPALIDGDLPGEQAALHVLDPQTGRDRIAVSDLDDHALAADGVHVLYRRDGDWQMGSLVSGPDTAVALSGLTMTVDPRAEWAEMFEHAWRLDRDLFFSKVMNGDDWTAVHDAYARLVPSLGSREDLVYLLSQMQGEMATSHAFIGGLDAEDVQPRLRTPRLGADFALDPASDRYRLARIYAGDPTRERFRSPLGAPGLDVQTGDYVLAIDGHDLRAPADPDSLLAGATGPVTLAVAERPGGARREVTVEPLRSDLDLRQHDWVEANRRKVDALSQGRVGYIFVPDFDALGSEDLVRQLQPQLDKQGVVIDVRWNLGGFTSQAVLNLLKRVRAGAFVNREGALEPLPRFTAPRAMVTIANAATSSDGDQFAYFFRAFGLGPVVGQRTWGGVQGIKGPWPLMDGLWLTIPKDSLASADGHWLIENQGVAPDLPVDPAPDEAVTGKDKMLETAVDAVLAELVRRPPAPLHAPAPLPAYPSGGEVPGASFGPPR